MTDTALLRRYRNLNIPTRKLATELGLSFSTVARFLRGDNVSKATRRKLEEAIRGFEMGPTHISGAEGWVLELQDRVIAELYVSSDLEGVARKAIQEHLEDMYHRVHRMACVWEEAKTRWG